MRECSLWICHHKNEDYISSTITSDDMINEGKLSTLARVVFSDCDEDIIYDVPYDDFVKFMKENGEKTT